uniref:Putative secreted peptide n=1 Tax=Anopheles braziliensis TaxID=58242 RepID=A0A2M3ZSD2_9DIPT
MLLTICILFYILSILLPPNNGYYGLRVILFGCILLHFSFRFIDGSSSCSFFSSQFLHNFWCRVVIFHYNFQAVNCAIPCIAVCYIYGAI